MLVNQNCVKQATVRLYNRESFLKIVVQWAHLQCVCFEFVFAYLTFKFPYNECCVISELNMSSKSCTDNGRMRDKLNAFCRFRCGTASTSKH